MKLLFENWRNFLVERARYVTSIDDAYEILKVDKDAPKEEIKKAYRKLALLHHPDREGGDELIFRKVGEAYDAIMNPKEPRWYAIGGASQDPAGSEPTTSVNVVEYMRTMPGGSQILKSLQEISAKVKEAIEKGQSIKREGTRLPAPIVIDRNNFNNFEAFVTLYSWREARDRIMVPPFIKERMLSVWKTTPFNGKLDKELLGHFQNWLRQFESEPEAPTQQPEPEATTQQPEPKMSPEEQEEFMNSWGHLFR